MYSICYPYYKQPEGLRNLLEHYSAVRPAIMRRFELIIVDDGSGTDEAYEILRDYVFPWRLFVILEDKPWNMSEANNIGIRFARNEWIIRTDLDHHIPTTTLKVLLTRKFNRHVMYKFQRLGRAKPESPWTTCTVHANTLLFHKRLFIDVGGYDERFAGHYGYEDISFTDKAERLAPIEILPYFVRVTASFRERTLHRDNSRNAKLRQQIQREKISPLTAYTLPFMERPGWILHPRAALVPLVLIVRAHEDTGLTECWKVHHFPFCHKLIIIGSYTDAQSIGVNSLEEAYSTIEALVGFSWTLELEMTQFLENPNTLVSRAHQEGYDGIRMQVRNIHPSPFVYRRYSSGSPMNTYVEGDVTTRSLVLKCHAEPAKWYTHPGRVREMQLETHDGPTLMNFPKLDLDLNVCYTFESALEKPESVICVISQDNWIHREKICRQGGIVLICHDTHPDEVLLDFSDLCSQKNPLRTERAFKYTIFM
jgi:hypothetical protein